MTYAFDIPGYVQGIRLSDDSMFYDVSTKRFKDLAGYDHLGNGLTINTGSPVFETVNGQRGVKLNNTFHGTMRSNIPWMGSIVAVLKPTYTVGTTVSRYPLIFGDAVTTTSNGRLQIVGASGSRRVGWYTASAQLQIDQSRLDNNTVVVAFSTDQQTRKAYATSDGVTVTDALATASTISGNAVAMSVGFNGVRFGNISGVADDVTEITDLYCHMFEFHFFKDNILLPSNLQKTKAFVDRLKAQYGVS